MSYCNSSTVWHSITWRQLPPGYCPPCPPRVPCRVSCHMMNTDVSVQTCVCAVESCDRATLREQHQRQGDVWHGRGKRRSVTTLRTRDQRCCCRGWRLTRGPGLSSSWYTTTDALFIEGRLTCGPCQGRLRVESLFTCDSDFLSQWQQYSS